MENYEYMAELSDKTFLIFSQSLVPDVSLSFIILILVLVYL